VSDQVQAFTEAQIREMATRGAALDGTRPSDRWHRTEETFGDNYRPAEDADPRSGRWRWLANTECGLQAS
jgi:hypothetical protein